MSTNYVDKIKAILKLPRPETLDEAITERDFWVAIAMATQEKLQAQQNRDSEFAAKIGLPDPITLEQAIAERNGWLTAAAHAHDGMEYYRGIVDEIGATIGPDAYTDDVGKLHDSVLRAKVAELVIARLGVCRPNSPAPIVPSAAQLEAEALNEIGFGELDPPTKDV